MFFLVFNKCIPKLQLDKSKEQEQENTIPKDIGSQVHENGYTQI